MEVPPSVLDRFYSIPKPRMEPADWTCFACYGSLNWSALKMIDTLEETFP
jgi:hypothetical protein